MIETLLLINFSFLLIENFSFHYSFYKTYILIKDVKIELEVENKK